MQILIAAQGVTPNSVEINTNCIQPATAPPADFYFRVQRALLRLPITMRLLWGESFSSLLLLPFNADRRNNISLGISKYGDTKSCIYSYSIDKQHRYIAQGDCS